MSKVEDALREHGADPETIDPRLGRPWGLRADIVHGGQADSKELVVNGWYTLETVCRTLLRNELGMRLSWPESPSDRSTLPPDIQSAVARREYEPPETIWHDAGEGG